MTCSITSETGSINNLNNLYFGVDMDSCIVYVNRALIEDLSDRIEYTVSGLGQTLQYQMILFIILDPACVYGARYGIGY